jgi:hypothetical protein
MDPVRMPLLLQTPVKTPRKKRDPPELNSFLLEEFARSSYEKLSAEERIRWKRTLVQRLNDRKFTDEVWDEKSLGKKLYVRASCESHSKTVFLDGLSMRRTNLSCKLGKSAPATLAYMSPTLKRETDSATERQPSPFEAWVDRAQQQLMASLAQSKQFHNVSNIGACVRACASEL